jgi:hypothetical protein
MRVMQLPHIRAFVSSRLQGEITSHQGPTEEDLRPQSSITYTEILKLSKEIGKSASVRRTVVYIIYLLTYLLTYGAELFLRSRQLCSSSRTSQHFTEPEGLKPCSKEHSTGPYPKPYPSNPLHPILSL